MMTPVTTRLAGLLPILGLLALTACSRGPDQAPLQVELLRSLSDKVSARLSGGKGKQAARPPLTRAGLDEIKDPYIEVTIEKNDVFAYLSRQQLRRDDSPGTVAVWRTEDNISLTLRGGVLVATRNLGNDILSSSALVEGNTGGPVRSGARRYHIRGLDNGAWQLDMLCSRRDLGVDPIVIVELRYPTRHIEERCHPSQPGRGGEIVNDYWVDSRSGRVWQSRQWAGPNVGYLRIRQLTTGG
ncbi:Group 4 capsule polysaccharide formation lipoprotein gfcB (plasmid) [Phaeobacter piscinae]|uniref:Group 4 capsule polysaccharide formation lipoprotein gfcB n=1 Tax=Phaeobacter piscinae TaxID=1580596 RepID=A0AAN1LCX6_9RHOB|nr:YjbF family lipoprotein [Phaeobacter piscinae]ATG45991.1 Group 4 capsule polysaccharide formation lipoprotein gfcB [Phaeobacter piscinae]AUR38314.1 Group 4 capsule polysaccharide formation lipoprotein gfcB [Phaeobacter piscinae]